MGKESYNKLIFTLLLYGISAVILILVFIAPQFLSVKVLSVLTFLVLVLFISGFLIKGIKEKKFEPVSDIIRYTMLCNNCGWEWMSNITKRGIAPQKCPNCNEKIKLEMIGWRKVKLLNKANKDLREFFRLGS